MIDKLVVDGFLQSFDVLQERAYSVEFGDLRNPVDGVVYPLICEAIPHVAREEVLRRLAVFLGREPSNITLFMRQSPLGVHVPHAAHSDRSMGTYSLMLYLNKEEHCQGGTSFLVHRKSGIAYHPEHPAFAALITEAQNDACAWEVCDMVEMRPNRAVIFNAARVHRAEPCGGFGDSGIDARVVLTCFFS